MFGFSFSELVVVIVVALVVIGPKDLPKMLRKLGQYAGKLRRMASELRAQSGIDDALRSEGLADDINEIRKLARGELDTIQRTVTADPNTRAPATSSSSVYNDDFYIVRDREFPRDGADSYGALPDNAIVYAEGLPKTDHAKSPLYVVGDPNGVIPEDPKPEEDEEEEDKSEAHTADDAPAADASAAVSPPEDAAAPAPTAPSDEAPSPDQPTSEAR